MNDRCPKCQAPKSNELQCQSCQLIFDKYKSSKFKLYFKKVSKNEEQDLLPYHGDSKKLRLVVFPATFALAFISVKTSVAYPLSYFSVWVHEFGHALMSWISGIKATPLSFGSYGMTFSSCEERSFFVFLCFGFLNILMLKNARRDKAPFIIFFIIPLLAFSMFMFFLQSDEKINEMIIAGGFLGEIILSLFMIISFYFRWPGKMSWIYFLRWPIIFIGFFTLIQTSSHWLEVQRTNSLYTFGTNFSEEAVSGVPGDLYRLMHDYDWGLGKFKKIYMSLCFLTWLIIISIYLFFLSNKIKNE